MEQSKKHYRLLYYDCIFVTGYIALKAIILRPGENRNRACCILSPVYKVDLTVGRDLGVEKRDRYLYNRLRRGRLVSGNGFNVLK